MKLADNDIDIDVVDCHSRDWELEECLFHCGVNICDPCTRQA